MASPRSQDLDASLQHRSHGFGHEQGNHHVTNLRNKILVALAVIVFSLGASSTARGQLMSGSYVDLGGGLTGWTIGTDWSDGIGARSAAISLIAHSDGIVQQDVPGLGEIVDLVYQADTRNGINGYDKTRDSWWYGGLGADHFGVYLPPFGGVDESTSSSASQYAASFGSDPVDLISGNTPLLYLVTDAPDGRVVIDGSVSRAAHDFSADAVFSKTGVHLTPGGAAAGYVRFGTTTTVTVSARNTGGGGTLSGTFEAVSTPEFSGPGGSFGPLAFGETATATYEYTPHHSNPGDQAFVNITSDAGNAIAKMGGIGDGPEFDDDAPSNGLRLGNALPGDPVESQFTIFNKSGSTLDLTDLTITGVRFEDLDGYLNWSTDLQPGTVIGGAESLRVTVRAAAGGRQGRDRGTLIIETDQGAPLGGDGMDFSFAIEARSVPEPSAALMALAAALGVVAIARRRTA